MIRDHAGKMTTDMIYKKPLEHNEFSLLQWDTWSFDPSVRDFVLHLIFSKPRNSNQFRDIIFKPFMWT